MMADANLDRGESEAIVLAQELDASLLIVDDGHARRYAIRKKMPIIGTVGILLLSKEQGLIAQVRPLLDQLRTNGFYLSPGSRQRILEQAGED